MKVTNYPQEQLLHIRHFWVSNLGSKNPVRVKEMTNIKYPQELRTRLRGEGREAQNYERERDVKNIFFCEINSFLKIVTLNKM